MLDDIYLKYYKYIFEFIDMEGKCLSVLKVK